MEVPAALGGLVLSFALGAGCLGASFTTTGSGTGGGGSGTTTATSGTTTGATTTGATTGSGGAACGDTQTDPENCGTCGHACALGDLCVAGACTCMGDLHCTNSSPSVCTQTSGAGDADHCGNCTTRCQDSQVCADGQCACRPGLTPCGGTCVDLATDAANCGACGTQCMGSESCVAPVPGFATLGKCVAPMTPSQCPPLYTACGAGSCVLTASMKGNPLNCGACNSVCQPNQVCTLAGTCQTYFASPSCTACPCAACGSGYTCCKMDGVPLCVLGDTCGF